MVLLPGRVRVWTLLVNCSTIRVLHAHTEKGMRQRGGRRAAFGGKVGSVRPGSAVSLDILDPR